MRKLTIISGVCGMAEHSEQSSLGQFLSDPATLVSLGLVAAGAAYYFASRPTAMRPPYPLDSQSVKMPVSSYKL